MANIEILGPKNLVEVIESNVDGYKLLFGYGLKLDHGELSHIRANYTIGEGEKETFFTNDMSVLEDVATLLPAEPFIIIKELFYVHQQKNLCFDVVDSTIDGTFLLPPIRLINRKLFEELAARKDIYFFWDRNTLKNVLSDIC